MAKKILILGVAMLMCLGIFAACENGNEELPFNAVIVSSAFRDNCPDIKESFLDENRTLGMVYKNDDWNPQDEDSEEYLYDETSPKYRTHILKEQARLAEVFNNLPQVDFENEILLVVFYSTTDNTRHSIKDLSLDGAVLKVSIKVEKIKTNNSAEPKPLQSIYVVKLDKLDAASAEILFI